MRQSNFNQGAVMEAKIWDGRTFWDVASEMEWV